MSAERRRTSQNYARVDQLVESADLKSVKVWVRIPRRAPNTLTPLRLAAIPPGSGPGFRRFESFRGDQNYLAVVKLDIITVYEIVVPGSSPGSEAKQCSIRLSV